MSYCGDIVDSADVFGNPVAGVIVLTGDGAFLGGGAGCSGLLALATPSEFAALTASASGLVSVTARVTALEAAAGGSVGSALTLTPADGAVLSASIIGVWAVAFAVRALIRVLHSGDSAVEVD